MQSESETYLHEVISAHARLFDTHRQAVIATTLEGRVVYWNDTAARIYGWSAGEVLGRDILDVTPTAISRDTAAEIMHSLRAGRSWSGQFPVRRSDGAEFIAEVRDIPVQDPRGELIGVVGVSVPAEHRGNRLPPFRRQP